MKRADKLLVVVTIPVGALLILYCALLFLPWYRTEEKALSPRTKLIEKHRIRFRPTITGSDLLLVEQELLFDGKQVWSSRSGASRRLRGIFHVSPDERFVAFEDWLHAKPVVIMNLATRQSIAVPSPDGKGLDDHYYVYPFSLHRWLDDSSAILAYVSGTFIDAGSRPSLLAYRDTWQIDPVTGSSYRTERLTKPWGRDLQWP